MPYKHTNQIIPKALKRSAKLTDEQRADIRELYKDGGTFRGIARQYDVDRKLIKFICVPSALEAHKEAYKIGRQDGRYYDREKHTAAMRLHRNYKQSLKLTNQLITL